MPTGIRTARTATLISAAVTLGFAAFGLSGLSQTIYILSPFLVGLGIFVTLGCAIAWLLLFLRGIAAAERALAQVIRERRE